MIVLLLVVLVVLALVVLAIVGPVAGHLHRPGATPRRALAQAEGGDLYRLAANSADGMAFRYAFASPLDTLRHRSRLLRTNPYGDRVEIRVVAPGRVGWVYGPPNGDGVRQEYELDPGVWAMPCDAAGRATGLPYLVR